MLQVLRCRFILFHCYRFSLIWWIKIIVISACSAAAAAAAPWRRCSHQTSSDDARYYGNHDDHVTEWWRHRRLVAQRRVADANFGRNTVSSLRLAADEIKLRRCTTHFFHRSFTCNENVRYARCQRRVYTVSQKSQPFIFLNNCRK